MSPDPQKTDTRKLYGIRVEIYEVVLAENEVEALKVFKKNWRYIAGHDPEDYGCDVHRATAVTYHKGSDLIYSDRRENITLDEALKIDPYMREEFVRFKAGVTSPA